MNKKGFTLVEILAAIAIIAVLAVIALPNVIKVYNKSRKNTFMSEVKEVYKIARGKFVNDSYKGAEKLAYAKVNSKNCANKLAIDGRKAFQYYVELDDEGNVIRFYATDGKYQYVYDDVVGLDIEDITEDAIHENMDDQIDIDCEEASSTIEDEGESDPSVKIYYTAADAELQIGSAIPSGVVTYYRASDVQSRCNFNVGSKGCRCFLEVKLDENSLIKSLSLGYTVIDKNQHFVLLPGKFDINVRTMSYSIPGSDISCTYKSDYAFCKIENNSIIYVDNDVIYAVGPNQYGCVVKSNKAYCSKILGEGESSTLPEAPAFPSLPDNPSLNGYYYSNPGISTIMEPGQAAPIGVTLYDSFNSYKNSPLAARYSNGNNIYYYVLVHLTDGVIDELNVGFNINNQGYKLKKSSYGDNKRELETALGSSNCTQSNIDTKTEQYVCTKDSVTFTIINRIAVSLGNPVSISISNSDQYSCVITSSGAYCTEIFDDGGNNPDPINPGNPITPVVPGSDTM